MKGKVALITGAAKGLGRAYAERLLERGAMVCITDVNSQIGHNTEAELQKKYARDRVFYTTCDVTEKSQLEDAVNHTLKKYGRMDILCNNAGIMHEKHWEKMLDINLMAMMRGTLLGIEYMSPPKGEGGHIINVASTAGLLPMFFGPVYSASKHGVVAFTRSLGGFSKRKHNVQINCICPSFARTDILKMEEEGQLVGKPETTAKLVQHIGVLEVSVVADAFMEILDNDRLSGGVMAVTPLGSKLLTMPVTIEELYDASKNMES